jgi:orotidine-5'-phosphate decarboxylase
LRALLPRAFILVTGYGSQGARGRDAAVCFNSDGMGAIVSSSRGITYSYSRADLTREAFVDCVRENTLRMIDDVTGPLRK